VNLDVAPGYAGIAQCCRPGRPVLGRTAHLSDSADKNNISPRIGFAWRPISKKSMVIRGGYGTYYNIRVYNTIANNMAQQPPFRADTEHCQFTAQSPDPAERLHDSANNPITNTTRSSPTTGSATRRCADRDSE